MIPTCALLIYIERKGIFQLLSILLVFTFPPSWSGSSHICCVILKQLTSARTINTSAPVTSLSKPSDRKSNQPIICHFRLNFQVRESWPTSIKGRKMSSSCQPPMSRHPFGFTTRWRFYSGKWSGATEFTRGQKSPESCSRTWMMWVELKPYFDSGLNIKNLRNQVIKARVRI